MERVFFGDFSMDVDDTSKVGDGSHTFGELYEHRTALFLCLCSLLPSVSWRSRKHSDGAMLDGYFIAGIDLPGQGQITYHILNENWDAFSGIRDLERAPDFDGHDSFDVIERLYGYAADRKTTRTPS